MVEGLELASQSIESSVYAYDFGGYGGVTLWYQDPNHWIDVLIYPSAAATAEVWVIEQIDGTATTARYPGAWLKNTWYCLRVDADSKRGSLTVYVDGNYLATYGTATTYRSGLSGVNSGNMGSQFDNFKLMRHTRAKPSK